MQMENPSRQRSLIILNVVRGGRKCISLFANEIKLLAWQSVCSSVSPSICLTVSLSVPRAVHARPVTGLVLQFSSAISQSRLCDVSLSLKLVRNYAQARTCPDFD